MSDEILMRVARAISEADQFGQGDYRRLASAALAEVVLIIRETLPGIIERVIDGYSEQADS